MGRSAKKRARQRAASGNGRPIKAKKGDPSASVPMDSEAFLRDANLSDNDDGSYSDDSFSFKCNDNSGDHLSPKLLALIDKKFELLRLSCNTAMKCMNTKFREIVSELEEEIDQLDGKIEQLIDKFEDEQPVDVCRNTVVIEGLKFEPDEDLYDKVQRLLWEIFGGRHNAPDIVQVIRLRSYNTEYPGIVKVAFKKLKVKKSVLNKKFNKTSEEFKDIRMRSSKSHAERVAEKNALLLLREMKLDTIYKMTSHGLLVPINYTGKGNVGQVERESTQARPTESTRGRGGIRGGRGNMRGRGGGSGGSVRGRTFTRNGGRQGESGDRGATATGRKLPEIPNRKPQVAPGPFQRTRVNTGPAQAQTMTNAQSLPPPPPPPSTHVNTDRNTARPKVRRPLRDDDRQFEISPPLNDNNNGNVASRDPRVMRQITRTTNVPERTLEVSTPPIATVSEISQTQPVKPIGATLPVSSPVQSYAIFNAQVPQGQMESTPEIIRYDQQYVPPAEQYDNRYYPQPQTDWYDHQRPQYMDDNPDYMYDQNYTIPNQNQVNAWDFQRRQTWMGQMMSTPPDFCY